MNLISFDMPDTFDKLFPWLERQIVGHNLAELVAELAAIHQARTLPADSVINILGGTVLEDVLSSGLKKLPEEKISELINQPYYLLDLQELIMSNGGPYWRQIPRSDEAQAASKLSWQLLRPKLTETPPTTSRQPASGEVAMPSELLPEGSAWYWQPWPWVVNIATAAAVFVAVYYAFRLEPGEYKPQTSTLVWTSPEDLSRPASPEQYWQRLASVKQWWFSEKPANKVQLALRMGQLSEGCSVLILHEHKPLSPADADQLTKKCREWATELNRYIAELQGENADVQEIQKKTDAWVNRVSGKLQDEMRG